MNGQRLTDEEICKIKTLHQKGFPQKKIAKIIECDNSTVKYWINRDFKRSIDYHQDYDLDSKIDVIQQMLIEGRSQEYIANECNCPKTRVYKFIHAHGLNKITSKDKVKFLYEKGYSNKEIAKQLCIPINEVSRQKRRIKNENLLKFSAKMEDENKNLTKQIELLEKENEKLKREIEAIYNIDYETSDIPKLKRRIYDLEEICDNLKKSLVLITNQLSTVRYSEYENTGE